MEQALPHGHCWCNSGSVLFSIPRCIKERRLWLSTVYFIVRESRMPPELPHAAKGLL